MDRFKKPPKNADQMDVAMWQKILLDPKEAKRCLANLITPNGRVKSVMLANGNEIPVGEVTEEQAHEFMTALCPDWAKN